MTTQREVTRRVTFPEALEIFKEISVKAGDTGYCAAMYGSVLKRGEGADLDIVCVPWAPVKREQLIKELATLGNCYFPASNRTSQFFLAVHLETHDGISVDIHIHTKG